MSLVGQWRELADRTFPIELDDRTRSSARSEVRITQLAPLADKAHGGKRTLPGLWPRSRRKRARDEETLAGLPPRDAPDPGVRGERSRAVPRRRVAGLPARRIGQEAVAVVSARRWTKATLFASTPPRSRHTLARARTRTRSWQSSTGRGGLARTVRRSMHLYDIERGNYGANAVIGGASRT